MKNTKDEFFRDCFYWGENGYTLANALEILNKVNDREVISIMYEDGSGKKFLYKLEGDNEYQFIDLVKFMDNLSNIQEIAKRHGLI